ncbi:phosphoglucosamine mutase [Arboricoccus pini]|uniref:Phosphoglucosamine mutase n=1 Tax=Arboricoccus pini TaxID=1963835 RepID=A0A212Q194_9PROT|nr:phosphoglucosamine mutase [Arboricoccus pini]SNB52938.1 phosphoglucosamine mutase [Arboricoccus pini]
MGRRLFGTDGIRGTANTEPMTAETALALGKAAGRFFRRGDHAHRVVIGKDTRLSGYMLEPALTAGFTSAGMNVILTGPIPTPAVAFLTRSLRADLGVVISASHNPFEDNGIKLFGPDGYKLSDEIELEIEALMAADDRIGLAGAADLGRAQRIEDARGRYVESLKNSFPRHLTLQGLKIVVDAANGAAYSMAADLFWELGADVVRIGNQPNGFNINAACGSTAPEAMRAAVVEHNADLGVALDGDADRLVLADEQGRLVDGDQVLGMITQSWLKAGAVQGGGIAATIMSNLGLETFVRGLGLDFHRTKVGDRYVVEAMRVQGYNIGGEQSGHIILSDFATTGDGLMAALQVLAVLRSEDRPLSTAARIFEPVPQRLVNVKLTNPVDLESGAIARAIEAQRRRLGDNGRVVVRKSGTEPLLRIMVEAHDPALLDAVIDEIRGALH